MFGSAAQVHRGFLPDKKVTADEANYPIVLKVRDDLHQAVHALYADFNAFKLTEGVPKTTAIFDMMKQIEAKQIAYDILAPLLDAMETTVRAIDEKYKEK